MNVFFLLLSLSIFVFIFHAALKSTRYHRGCCCIRHLLRPACASSVVRRSPSTAFVLGHELETVSAPLASVTNDAPPLRCSFRFTCIYILTYTVVCLSFFLRAACAPSTYHHVLDCKPTCVSFLSSQCASASSGSRSTSLSNRTCSTPSFRSPYRCRKTVSPMRAFKFRIAGPHPADNRACRWPADTRHSYVSL